VGAQVLWTSLAVIRHGVRVDSADYLRVDASTLDLLDDHRLISV